MDKRLPLLALLALSTSGCIAKTLVDVATAPVRVASKAVDLATTSQSEADEKRGRELRKREERLGKLERDYRKYSERCDAGDHAACSRRDAAYAEMQGETPTIPAQHD